MKKVSKTVKDQRGRRMKVRTVAPITSESFKVGKMPEGSPFLTTDPVYRDSPDPEDDEPILVKPQKFICQYSHVQLWKVMPKPGDTVQLHKDEAGAIRKVYLNGFEVFKQ